MLMFHLQLALAQIVLPGTCSFLLQKSWLLTTFKLPAGKQSAAGIRPAAGRGQSDAYLQVHF